MRMVITGISGLLGNNLAYCYKDKYEILGLYNTHPVSIEGIMTEKCDITDEAVLGNIFRDFKPDIVIHCASLTNIDECEINKDATKLINVHGTRKIVEAIEDFDSKLIYISTDSVYDGIKGHFSEKDRVTPQNYYGLTKYEGEGEVSNRQGTLILRTNIFGWNILDKKSLGEWILGELQEMKKVNGFKDAYFSSIYTMELAKILDLAIRDDLSGVFNCGSVDTCSKYEFCRRMADWFGFDEENIVAISIDDFQFRAKRGKKLNLDVSKVEQALGLRLPNINRSIESFYRDFKAGLPQELKKKGVKVRSGDGPIPYGRQSIDHFDIKAVVNVLRSRRITQGPKVEEFEDVLREYCGAKYAVAVNSGTSALHLACLVVGVEQGDEVITSPITFVASANCAVYCGGVPIFADIDNKTYNISWEEVEKRISNNTKAVIPVHFAGQSGNMEMIQKVVRRGAAKFGHKIFIIEDASHALGSEYKDTRVGSCRYADMSVMSFHPVKHITTGEGGAVLTNDISLYKKLRRLRSHGITSSPDEFVYNEHAFETSTHSDEHLINPWYYEQQDLGFNYRITDIQCSLGLEQLRKIDKYRRRRREIVDKYNESFARVEFLQTPYEDSDCKSNFHLYVLLIDFNGIGASRSKFMNELKKMNIQTQVHYIPVYTQPFYQDTFGTAWGDCPNAEAYYKRCLSIPLYPAMTDNDVERVIEVILHLVDK
jgi:UDP-4-amino-4,6-dideoxy-N-acetyl-beta-L-altrosamine transaminase/dTDP-4-dehydrorhamnose reductase